MPQQPFQVHVLGTLAAVMLASCNRTINTLPPTVTPADPVQQYALRIPDSLEIKAVDFDAALYPNVSGGGSLGVDTKLGGRAFVKVYAVGQPSSPSRGRALPSPPTPHSLRPL